MHLPKNILDRPNAPVNMFQGVLRPDPATGKLPRQQGVFNFYQRFLGAGISANAFGVPLTAAVGYFLKLFMLSGGSSSAVFYLYPSIKPIGPNTVLGTDEGQKIIINGNQTQGTLNTPLVVPAGAMILPVAAGIGTGTNVTCNIYGIQLYDCPENWQAFG